MSTRPGRGGRAGASAASSSTRGGRASSSARGSNPASSVKGKGGDAATNNNQNEAEMIDGKELWMATDALSKTKAMRNLFQLERDKLSAFWEITKREIENVKAEIRNKEREKAELEERHQVELKVRKQQMKHLLYEQQVQIAQLKLECERKLKAKEDEHREVEDDLRSDRRDLVLHRREQELIQREAKRALREQQDKDTTDATKDFERQMKELHLKYEHRIRTLREEMENQRKEDIQLIERRKMEHIAELKESHDRAFQEIRDYYLDISTQNIESIRALKDQVFRRKIQEASIERALFQIAQANKRVTEPLSRAQRQKQHLENELANYNRDQIALETTKQELRALEQKFKSLSWEHEVLSQRYGKMVEDRDLIFAQYNDTLQEIQKKAMFKRVLLNRKLDVHQALVEKKDAQLAEVVRAANPDQETVDAATKRFKDIVDDKDRTIENLQQLLAASTLRHQKQVEAWEDYCRKSGVELLSSES